MRQSPLDKDVKTKAEEPTDVGAVTKLRLGKTQQIEEVFSVCCSEL